jgi:hypothetical protein
MGPRCSSAETQVCHRSYIIADSRRYVMKKVDELTKNRREMDRENISGFPPISTVITLKATVIYKIYMQFITNI